jgi:transcriptional regulator with XRE-family HTH domain
MHDAWRERLKRAVQNRAAVTYTKQASIAQLAGVTPETLSRILNAEHQRPSFETIVRIALASKEHVGYLIDERVLSAHDEGTFLVALYALREQLGTVITLLEERVHEDQLPPREHTTDSDDANAS